MWFRFRLSEFLLMQEKSAKKGKSWVFDDFIHPDAQLIQLRRTVYESQQLLPVNRSEVFRHFNFGANQLFAS